MRLHEKQIYNFTYRMLGSEGEAEDLTQDIFIAAFLASWIHHSSYN